MSETLPAIVDEQKIAVNEEIFSALELADAVVHKTYLEYLDNMQVIPCPDEINNLEVEKIARFFKVERIVTEKNENNRDKMASVFHAVASCGGSMLVLIHSDGKDVSYYFGTKTPPERSIELLEQSEETLEKTLKGNFPGTKTNRMGEKTVGKIMESVFSNVKFEERQEKHICTVTGIAALRSEEENREKLFIQGLEKLVNSMQGEKYSLLLIADPVSQQQIDYIKKEYEDMYSQLTPLATCELSYGENVSDSVSKSITKGFSKSINESVTKSLTHTKGSFSSHTHTSSNTFNVGYSSGKSAGINFLGLSIGKNSSYNLGYSRSKSNSYTSGTNESTAKGIANTTGTVDTTSDQNTDTESETKGKTWSIQRTLEDKSIKNILEKLDMQLKRIDACKDIGMWNCSVYCLSDEPPVCKIAASVYQSLLRGEGSSIETGVITQWSKENAQAIIPYLAKMHHPDLTLSENIIITPASLVSTAELTIHAGIPQTSVSGLPVLEMAAFGREVSTHWESSKKIDEKPEIQIPLGSIYHMGNKEDLPVLLKKKSLTMHTFITGSTGSGKSNTVYKLLNEIKKSGAKFLVIEPAKGEYKNVFGKPNVFENPEDDVSVYGTNPELTPLLRINPFKFPNGSEKPSQNIHILEHLDRLVEIFNVCWPMYAAMPAVLKEAIEASYEQAGWDLPSSTNVYTPERYPTFADVISNIRKIIDSSEYSAEVQGNYKGSLITRLKSLTNGINGQIFTNDEIGDEALFDKNVIVDLSRVGTMETKALIMGILVMKLHEYRLTSGKMNEDLQHVTVLEEAHNLLKRTSTEQSSESSNLLGKSVEMLANAIAEMRTYGEGFIIADQSPGLLDMSVIRNTNTKIILRLPDEGDRELVGKAASLNDDQIVELAKLQCGVAAVYQNDWLQPVLCKVEEFKYDKEFVFHKQDSAILEKSRVFPELIKKALNGIEIKSLKEEVEKINLEMFLKLNPEKIVKLFSNCDDVFKKAKKSEQVNNLKYPGLYDYLIDNLEPSINDFSPKYRNHILKCIVSEICKNDEGWRKVPPEWASFINNMEAKHE